MSVPHQQPSFNPEYDNPYGPTVSAPPPRPPPAAGWNFGSQPPPPPQVAMADGAHIFAAEEGQASKYSIQFNDITIRAAFVRKVFILVTMMLLVVAAFTAIPFIHPPAKLFIYQSPALTFGAYAAFLVVYLVLMCCESVRRSFPTNLIMTAVFTLAAGYFSMVISSRYDINVVLMALILTTLCCGSVIVFASQTKYDLTSAIGIVCIIGFALFFYGIFAVIAVMIWKVKFLYTIYALLSCILFMMFLAIDVQMMMGGRQYEISPEDHIFAAIQIFMDILYIFWHLLQFLGDMSD